MTEGERSIVSIAHTNEKHRSPERVLNLTREALSHLGGMEAFVKAGQRVLIKPNQTVFYSAEEGCTTDPLLVGALIRLAKEAGAARVQVAESSGGFFSSLQCMAITGMLAVAEKEGAEVIDLGSDSTPNLNVEIPNGLFLKEAPIPAPLLEADVIINAPKAKNHHIEPISGALKNWVGAVNQKWRNHNHGDEEHIERFMDIMTVTKPHLCVTDALICGEGDGPIANLPRWCGCILASADPVATDIQSESSEYTHGCHPDLADEAEMLNERRFLSLDLNYGRKVSSGMYEYLLDNKMTRSEYEFFMTNDLREHCIIGNDYYASNEHLLIDETTRVFAGDIFGYYVVTKDYYKRYNLPMMCTETNMTEPNATGWMWKTWANIQRLRHDGIPVCGMTWYSLVDQIDWDTALREINNRVHKVGLFDLERKINPVGEEYKKLIHQWSFTPLLPTGPLTLVGQWNVAQEQEKEKKAAAGAMLEKE